LLREFEARVARQAIERNLEYQRRSMSTSDESAAIQGQIVHYIKSFRQPALSGRRMERDASGIQGGFAKLPEALSEVHEDSTKLGEPVSE
jgi:hypothetical protein